MLPMSELEYGGIVARLRKLDPEFAIRNGQGERTAAHQAAVTADDPD